MVELKYTRGYIRKEKMGMHGSSRRPAARGESKEEEDK